MIGGAHRVFIVLDDDHRVTELRQPAQGEQQAIVIPRVQADRRLVENVENAHEPRAHLTGQTDPLGLAAGKRRRGAIKRQVMQPDIHQEREPGANFLEQLFRDRPRDGVKRRRRHPVERRAGIGIGIGFRSRRRHRVKEAGHFADRHGPELDQGLATDRDGPGTRIEPRPLAFRTCHAPHEWLELIANRSAAGAAILGEQLGDDPWPFFGMRPALVAAPPAVHDHAVAGTVEPGVPGFFIEVAPGAAEHRSLLGTVGIGLEVGGQSFEKVPPPPADVLDRPEGCNRSIPDRERWVRHQKRGIKIVANPQAVAGQAHPLRAIEAEKLRAGRIEPDAAGCAGIMRRQQPVIATVGRDDERAVAQFERLLDRFDEPPALSGREAGRGLEPIDDDFNLMLDLPIERQVIRQVDHWPLTRARTYPARARSSKRSLYSPF